MNNYKKLNEIDKMEDKVRTMEKVNSMMSNSLRTGKGVRVPQIQEFEKNRRYYIKLLLPQNEQLTAEGNKEKYSAKHLQELYKDKREKEMKELLEENIKREDEIDDIYMTAINTKLDMLEKQHQK